MFNQIDEIPLEGARLLYHRAYIDETDQLFRSLDRQVNWQQPELYVYGKVHKTPRLVSFVGDAGIAYRYSGHRHEAEPWPECLAPLRARLEREFQLGFNCALLNYYRDGNDAMGFHSDDEPALGPAPAVASVSLGAERDFMLRRKVQTGEGSLKLSLENGSLLLMLPPTQANWQHALPRRRGETLPRINITFRRIYR